ncbi:RidA family protein [Pedobacter mucosus]|uniref:RidA family protein n=1 Tax=Pedobacter mucosus TaxID=2895286 RepID=UPI001EE3B6A4|nr:RidA family protein [Pedobacter mucosus]UKT65027.1 RidA family protein [Pedobacter mucosus]
MSRKLFITLPVLLFGSALFAQKKTAMAFSDYREAGGLIYLSGQTGMPGQINQEVSRALGKVRAILTSAGSSFDKVVTVQVYLTDLGRYEEFNELYKQYFMVPFPSRTCIGVAGLPQHAHVEITVKAIK